MWAGRLPQEISYNQIVHYDQSSFHGNFQLQDYGPNKNLERYGQHPPPILDISKYRYSKIPLALFTATFDTLSLL
jgi:hypothetical protein